jgi:parvulin-like peptidyl-prolyl isomerase
MSRSRTHLFFLVLALAAALGAAVLAACGDAGGGTAASPSSASDPVALLVDGSPVHRSAVEAVRAEFRLGGTSDAEARAENEAVRRELVRREAQRLGVTADPKEVASRRAAMADKAGSKDALTVALQRVSMSAAQLRRGLEDGVLHDAVQNAKFGRVRATGRQALAYYDAHRRSFRRVPSVHLWSIQVKAELIAQSALTRLRSGRPFKEVARQFTNDLQAKDTGGDLGRVALASLPRSILKAVEATPAGEVSKPVAGPGGWYLLKATGRTSGGIQPFSDVRQAILSELTRRKRFAALEAWLDAARDKATVTRP